MKRTLIVLGVTLLFLLAIGFVLLASAGEVSGLRFHKNPYYYVTHQAIWLIVALVAFLVAFFWNYQSWRRWPALTIGLYLVTCALLGYVLTGPYIKGSRRWIELGGVNIQPSEFAKISVVIVLAVFLDRVRRYPESFWRDFAYRVLPAIAVFGVPVLLIVKEPDFGSTLVVGVTCAVVCYVAKFRLLHLAMMGVIGACGVLPSFLTDGNRMRRLAAWFPEDWAARMIDVLNLPENIASSDKIETALHQKNQALIAIRNGGLGGMGFNQSLQKQRYLPEAHTDFIFAIGAEEWGLVFSLVLLALFVSLYVCGFLIALRAPDNLGRYIAAGITFLLFFQALFNIGVVCGALPTKGIALPFISYGGTNLVASMCCVGILFNIGRKNVLPKGPQKRKIMKNFHFVSK